MKILQRTKLSTHVFLTLALDGDGERKKEIKKERNKQINKEEEEETGQTLQVVYMQLLTEKLLPLILTEPWSSRM
jgi:hypothetical protein